MICVAHIYFGALFVLVNKTRIGLGVNNAKCRQIKIWDQSIKLINFDQYITVRCGVFG